MRITLYTLFPQLVTPYLGEALLGRAIARGLLQVETRDLRRFAGNRTGRVDDAPYGGGAGMVIRVDVAAAALAEAAADRPPPDETVLLSPAGRPLDQGIVEHFASLDHVVILSGRYEGFDARVESLVTREVSLGDFVLMGGELPALCLVEAIARLQPGALGDAESHRQESFSTGLLDYPEYTRPLAFEGDHVPEVLLSGHHAKIDAWRRREALRRTLLRRPELLRRAALSEADAAVLDELRGELPALAGTRPDDGRDERDGADAADGAEPDPAQASGDTPPR
ncbi:MAG: tRNA (guanosine(37)-N1)-methyltransferase TrmD [Deinococcales bacterium]